MGNRSIQCWLAALAVLIAPALSHAAGLGRLTIQSALGQPLLGEIELVSVQRDELATLGARIAPPEAFSQANVQYNSVLTGIRVSVERRAGGQPYVRLTSTRPINEPFLELLVELTWSSGRLVREYTALLDPPGFAPPQPVAPVVVPAPQPKPAAATPVPAKPVAAAPAPAPAAAQGKTYGPVKPGDTLAGIAGGVRPEGMSLDQVLVGLFRANQDAFINNNMNLLRTGRILRVPEAAELAQVTAGDATKEVRVQAADWNAYRQKVAGAVSEARAQESRAVTGRITARVDDGAAAKEPPKEVLKITKGEAGKAGAAPAGDAKAMQDRLRSLEEEATAREKALKDANDRIAALEKTIKDMQRLVEMKGLPTPPKPEPAPVAKVEPAPSPKPEVKPEPVAKAEPAPPPVPTEKPAVEPEKVVQEPPKPAPKPPVVAPPPPPPPPKSFVDEVLEDPAMLGGGLAALVGLGGLGYWMARRKRAEAPREAPKPVAKKEPVSAGPAAAAAAVAATAAATGALAQTTTTVVTPAADDVDPIQEAEVYINYGRDAQAEEILKEAMAKAPGRIDLKTKLLEIYAARKSKNDFNPLAQEVHAATAGAGAPWLKVAQMGYILDPGNALYADGKAAGPPTIPPVAGTASEIDLDFDLDMVSKAAGAPTTVTDLPLDAAVDPMAKTLALSPEKAEGLRALGAAEAAQRMAATQPVIPDFDLGAEPPAAPSTDIALEPARARAGPITDINLEVPSSFKESNVIDFEFDDGKTAKIPVAEPAHDQTVVISPENQIKAADLGVEIDLTSLDAGPPAPAEAEPPEVHAEPTADISFDFELPADATATIPPKAPKAGAADVADITDITDATVLIPPEKQKPAGTGTDFALETISFDLGEAKAAGAAPDVQHDEHWYDVQTKFDLAKAYQEMGDKEGAREILAEVIKEGDAQQKAEAEAVLAKLS